MLSRTIPRLLCALLPAAMLLATAHAQEPPYPTKAVRMIVPFPPGGGTDLLARIIGQKLTEGLGVPMVVENRPGAGGVVGADVVAKARADGYTLLTVSASHTINPSIYKKLPYDTVRDFAPVTLLAGGPGLLVVHPSIPARTVKEFIAFAKARPGLIAYASAGTGTPPHLGGELFKSMAGIDLTHIPYKGNGPAYTDLISGQVPVMFPNVSTGLQYVKAGRIRALAVTSLARARVAPEIPTIDESGVPGYELNSWYGALTTAGTPAAIITRLQQEIAKALQLNDVRDKLVTQGMEPAGSTPAEFAAVINAEIGKWAKVAKQSGLKAE